MAARMPDPATLEGDAIRLEPLTHDVLLELRDAIAVPEVFSSSTQSVSSAFDSTSLTTRPFAATAPTAGSSSPTAARAGLAVTTPAATTRAVATAAPMRSVGGRRAGARMQGPSRGRSG